MKHTLPLNDLIKQLQEMENKNPGIEVALNDNEWGIGSPTISIEKVYKHEEYEGLHPITEDDYKRSLEGIEQYKHLNWEELWKSLDEDMQSYYQDVNGLQIKYTEVDNYHHQVIKNYENSREIVTLKLT